MADAIYARQSVEKKDSISVESQIAFCRYEAHGEACMEYTDRGFSGKDTNRPGFEQMMSDIQAGKISRVIVYKLDRISRSILDFANMMELFEQYHVEFVSSTEKFDTSTPIGRAMLHICIVFAQLERETIQKRVADAYYARCRRGFYMGGRIPYGYRLTNAVIDGIHTSMYEEVPEESAQLKLMYSMYADQGSSLGDIVRYLNGHRIKNLRGADWNTARISEMLRNPVYVKADIEVYRFFQSRGVSIHNPAEDFTGSNACYFYKRAEPGGELVLAPHQGIVSARVWLACRRHSLGCRQSAVTGRAKNSWLSGKLKCGNCGYAMTVKKSKTKWGRYFVCSRSGTGGSCRGTGCTIYADVLEEYMSAEVKKRLSKLSALERELSETEYPDSGQTWEQNDKKRRLMKIEEEMESLCSKVSGAGNVLMKYIDRKLSELDMQKQELRREIAAPYRNPGEGNTERTAGYGKAWDEASFAQKQAAVDVLIRVIRIADGSMEVDWKF